MIELAFQEPYLAVPRVAADALTVGVVASADVAPSALRFRMSPQGGPDGRWLERQLDGSVKSLTTYFTYPRLEPGVTYVLEAQAETALESATVSDTITWAPDGVWPPDDPRFAGPHAEWRWEDYAGAWFSMMAWYWREDPFLARWFSALGQEFQRLATALEAFQRTLQPSRADGTGLALWENLLAIQSPPSSTLDQRRALVMSHLRARVDPSASTFVAVLRLLLGAEPVVRENYADYELLVDLAADPERTVLIEEVLARIAPAHLVVTTRQADFVLTGPERFRLIGGVPLRGRSVQTMLPGEEEDGLGFDEGGFAE